MSNFTITRINMSLKSGSKYEYKNKEFAEFLFPSLIRLFRYIDPLDNNVNLIQVI